MKAEILTRDELLGLEEQETGEILASMNFLGLPVLCLSIDSTINAINELAAQVFQSTTEELCGANFHELCAKYQLDFPIFNQENAVFSGEIVEGCSPWISNDTENAAELKWSVIRHLDQNYKTNGFILVITNGFQHMLHPAEIAETPHDEYTHKVLLIEDNLICQKMARHIFESLSCEVTIARDARQALRCLHDKFDIIFLDIGLPGRDGISLAREFRRRLHLRTPIIATTGYAWDVKRFKEVGINEYIKKPLSRIKLQRALVRYL